METSIINTGIGNVRTDSRFRLVILAVQRARQLIQGSKPLVQSRSARETTIALEEALYEKFSYLTGKEAREALKQARLRESLVKPKTLLPAEDTEEIKKDLAQFVVDAKKEILAVEPEGA
jgi:DNA-directed RNA polymerase subunit omega